MNTIRVYLYKITDFPNLRDIVDMVRVPDNCEVQISEIESLAGLDTTNTIVVSDAVDKLEELQDDGSYMKSLLIWDDKIDYSDEKTAKLNLVLSVPRAVGDDVSRKWIGTRFEHILKTMDMYSMSRQRAADAKERFLSRVSHEIRTPMNVIVGMTEVLGNTVTDQNQRVYLQNIKHAGDSLLRLVDDILDFSRNSRGNTELAVAPYNINELIEELGVSVRALIGDRPIKFEVSMAEQLPDNFEGDVNRIRQIMYNLLDNAVKFTDSGSVKLDVAFKEKDVNLYDLKFTVSDTGCGIKSEELNCMFEMFGKGDVSFDNRDIGGIGIGLAIVKQLAELMNGHVAVDSVYGEGSVFSVTIEQSSYAGDIEATDEVEMDLICNSVRFLFVDDNSMNLEVMRGYANILKAGGDFVDSGAAAIEKAMGYQYDLIFMDRMMPGMSGEETIRRIRSLGAPHLIDVPIISLSADVSEAGIRSMKGSGANGYLPKPVGLKAMKECLIKYLPKSKYTLRKKIEVSEDEKFSKNAITYLRDKGLNIENGIRFCGGESQYVAVLRSVYKIIDSKSELIMNYLDDIDNTIRDYTIEVHALKTNCRTIGSDKLGEDFYELEMLGKAGNSSEVLKRTSTVIEEFKHLKGVIEPVVQTNKRRDAISERDIFDKMEKICEAVADFDLGRMDEIIEAINEYEVPAKIKDMLDELIDSADNIDYDNVEKVAKMIQEAVR